MCFEAIFIALLFQCEVNHVFIMILFVRHINSLLLFGSFLRAFKDLLFGLDFEPLINLYF